MADSSQSQKSSPEAAHSTPSPGDHSLKKRFKTSKGEGLWLMAFSDLSMILISFFILLLASSTMNQKKAEVIKEAMQAKTSTALKAKKDSLTAVSRRIENEIKRLKLEKSAQVTFDDAGVAIEFKDGLLFGVASSSANPKFENVVGQVMRLIATTPEKYQLKIEGHTDDLPIKSSDYPSNWELSSARAISLMHQFSKRRVNENRMSVVAYAHTRPKRATSGLTGQALAEARAANRRVVIRIEPI